VYREVLLENGTRADIINFYNQLFIPTMEGFLLNFQTQRENEVQNTSNTSGTTIVKGSSIYISPMKLRATPMKPGEFLFAFGVSPMKDLMSINETLRTPRGKSKPKKLFDDPNHSSDSSSNDPKRKFDEDSH
jgi:hypothetical protein